MTTADRAMPLRQKIYFLSDFHLGAPNEKDSLERERRICRFLDEAALDASEIFLMGDLFDFWYEYRTVVPKGFVRLLGKLALLSDAGIALHLFVGNHDMWVADYFKKELSMSIHFEPITLERHGLRLHIGHGDGLGPGDHGYKRLKWIFRNPLCQSLFGLIPPAVGMGIANFFSRRSRAQTGNTEEHFWGPDKEWLIHYCHEKLAVEKADHFIFGHRHLPIDWALSVNGPNGEVRSARYINLGDWIRYDSYAVLDNAALSLRFYTGKERALVTNRSN